MTLSKQTQNFKKLAVGLLGSTMLIAAPAFAQASAPAHQTEAEASVETSLNAEVTRQADEKRAKLFSRAVSAVKETDNAIAALEDGDSERALEALAGATGELDIILAREPSLALAPIDVSTARLDLIASVDDIKEMRNEIQALVKSGELQEARLLMKDFGSEVRVTTTNMPLGTYPDALKSAAALIDDGEMEAARVVLDTALGTFVVQDVIAPIPLIRAQSMLDLAQSYLADEIETDGEEMSQDDRIEAAQVLRNNAAYQVEMAKALGYGDIDLYRALESDLDKLKKQVDRKGDTGGLFSSLRRQIEALASQNDET
ncbi:MAG: YfdX family protein [Hellea sp.]|nr:YfdX family protein [Hellea sp.]